MPLARPLRTRFALAEDAGIVPVELPRRGTRAAGLIVGALFAAFSIAWFVVIHELHFSGLRNVGDLVSLLFRLFWVIGWGIGVGVLGLLTVLLLFYRECFYLAGERLVSASRVGPLRMIGEYDLAELRNLRTERGEKDGGVRVRFDYGGGSRTLGDLMPAAEADRVLAVIRAGMPAEHKAVAPMPKRAAPPQSEAVADVTPAGPWSTLALVAANLVPLAGVLFAGWRLDQTMVLFWAESAFVAFYTLARMAVVGRWLAIPAGIFFLAHFGAFMAIHFLFIYEIFVRGPLSKGREPPLGEALTGVFVPLWPALLALFLSHGVSFFLDFYGRTGRSTTMRALMAAPYSRVVAMHLTLLVGGWVVLALHDPRPALAILIVLKIVADLHAHRASISRNRRSCPPTPP